jgi:ubiquinone/menaquinone biosynthesis C-methylase UbiE
MPALNLNEQVRGFWELAPCGTGDDIAGGLQPLSREWFERIEAHRYAVEPYIHSIAQFTRHRGKRILEVGVGAGTDHLQWARAGCECYGVDLTEAGVETTRARLALYGLESRLQRVDAETLPFPDATFDVVYSWGVIHHSERPEDILSEIRRVLRPGGIFIGMVYGRRSLATFKVWIRHALLRGRPWRSFADVIWHHVESIGTKAYTTSEARALLAGFTSAQVEPLLTSYDLASFPRWLARFFPDDWGWFITLRATK